MKDTLEPGIMQCIICEPTATPDYIAYTCINKIADVR